MSRQVTAKGSRLKAAVEKASETAKVTRSQLRNARCPPLEQLPSRFHPRLDPSSKGLVKSKN